MGRLESGAAADRCHHEVKWLVARMATGLDKVVRSLMVEPDLDQFRLFFRLVLTEVGAHSTLSVLDLQHGWFLSVDAYGILLVSHITL